MRVAAAVEDDEELLLGSIEVEVEVGFGREVDGTGMGGVDVIIGKDTQRWCFDDK